MDYLSYLQQTYRDARSKQSLEWNKYDLAMQILKQEIHNSPHITAEQQTRAIKKFIDWVSGL